MKTLIKKIALACLLLLVATIASAYSFEYEGYYYNISSSTDLTCVITYKEFRKETETYIGDIVIPETVGYNGNVYKVVGIDDYAFYNCSSLTSITIPEGVTSIGRYAFRGCSSLASVTIPEGVTSIRDYTFASCSSLASITIPEGVTSIGDDAFYGCSSLTSITIPEGVTSIGDDAFFNCSSLTSIAIPEGVTSIGTWAFFYCSSLTSVTIPEGVTSIGERAFSICSGLTSINIPESVTSIGDNAFDGCRGLTSITIPESVTSIGSGAFSDCSALTSITIPEGVTSIGNGVFQGCSSLHEIIVDDENSYFTSINGVLYSKNVTKIYCHPAGLKETTFTIPKTVSSIEPCAFFGCSSLTNIDIPSSVTTIGDAAFGSCTNLKDIVIPATVTEIGYSFARACNLQSVYIEDAITPLEIINNFPNVYFSGGIRCDEIHIGRNMINSLDDKDDFYVDYTKKEGYTTFIIPDNIGGRYSVLTAVGLLPIATAGINIDELMEGAKIARDRYDDENLKYNECYKYAVIRNMLYEKEKNIELFVTYEPTMHYFIEWWKQLFGESEGKDGKGIYPSGAEFTTDLHSLGQYIQDGRRNLFETVLSIKNTENDITMKSEEDDLDKLNYLEGKKLPGVESISDK